MKNPKQFIQTALSMAAVIGAMAIATAPGWGVNQFYPASQIAPSPGGLHFYWLVSDGW